MSWTDTPDELYDRQENDPTEPYNWEGPMHEDLRYLPGLYVVGETEEGDESYLSGPWFSDEEAEADRATWGGETSIVGYLRRD